MRWDEFLRQLGAEPHSQDPEFMAARRSSSRFEEAARDAERFERKLNQAIAVSVPPGLLEALQAIPDQHVAVRESRGRWWLPAALAAGVLVAVTLGIFNRPEPGWESLESYLVSHYASDGRHLEALAAGRVAADVQAVLAGVGYAALPELESMVGYIKHCPTPDGRGVHMVVHTDEGPVTVILMPSTAVIEGKVRLQNGMRALIYQLGRGAIAVMDEDPEVIHQVGPLVHQSLVGS